MSKLNEAFKQFDDYNKNDPHVFIWEGVSYPQEYFLALKVYEWVDKLAPDASEELLLASRCQHIGRWEIPRAGYREGRDGYLRWRRGLALYHTEKAAAIMKSVGYKNDQLLRVKQIILKQKIKTDKEVQVMENALCLVFLEYQYEEFHPKHPPETVMNILKRSLVKMDEHGHEYALRLNYSEKGLFYVNEALKKVLLLKYG